MRLDIDNQVLTQLNKHCLFAIKFSRSVEFAASQIIYSTQLRPDRLQDPSIQDNPLSKQCNTSTCYATAPLMQTPAPAAMLHLQCNTCYAKHLLLIQTPAPNSRQRPLLSDTPTKMIEPRREIYRNLG